MRHVPVLANELVDGLELKPGEVVVDCTLGDAGHAALVLPRIIPGGKLIGIDADPEAILRAKDFLYEVSENVIFERSYFQELAEILDRNELEQVDVIYADLGWSTPQFEERKRGFSFQKIDEKLDMRFCGASCGKALTASEIVNTWDEDEIAKILRLYGEEKFASKIAQAIVQKREEYDLETVGDLVDVVVSVYKRMRASREKIHPATRTFQALRIAVNQELDQLKSLLNIATERLKPGGRLAIITFHSLEDRMVKHFFQAQSQLEVVNKKPIIPSDDELSQNNRARSAKLRIARKL
ncbi:16S rRNA (cytosine(1402)-N(4))-methyltransferase RsmH [Candidatus Nomurabacteria bacterium]|nr:16S rRNA (cytosine(1402)-N(4))-methyltransferase RsmH [Candidatus Nomurabacteria bacterium]